MAKAQRRELAGGLVLRHVEGEADVEGVACLAGEAFGQDVASFARNLCRHYPGLDLAHYLIIEDPALPPSPGTPVVATLCLIPQTWRLAGVTLPVAEVGVVATDPRYRGCGLQRTLLAEFDRVARASGYALACLLGIPGFYSRFGYFFASPADDSASLPVATALQAIEDDPLRDRSRVFGVRPCLRSDLSAVRQLWEEENGRYVLRAARSEDLWEYLLRLDQSDSPGKRYVITEGDRVAGAFGFWSGPGRQALFEVVTPDRDVALEAIRFAAASATAAGSATLLLRVAEDGPVRAAALSVGGREEPNYGWQVRLLDRPALIRALAPVLEERLAASPFRSLAVPLVIDLYSSRLVLSWTGGRLAGVREETTVGVPPATDLSRHGRVRLPEEAFTQLVLGYRTIGELARERCDVRALRGHRDLLAALFPRLPAWLEPWY